MKYVLKIKNLAMCFSHFDMPNMTLLLYQVDKHPLVIQYPESISTLTVGRG